MRPRPSPRAMKQNYVNAGDFPQDVTVIPWKRPGQQSSANQPRSRASCPQDRLSREVLISKALGSLSHSRTDFLGRVNSRGEVLEEVSSGDALVVDEDFISVIRLDNQCIKDSGVADCWCWGSRQVLLLELLGDWVLVTEDEVNLKADI